jgi:hypothetical protein
VLADHAPPVDKGPYLVETTQGVTPDEALVHCLAPEPSAKRASASRAFLAGW